MAGLFYMPRLFVYHTDTGVGSSTDIVFKIMEGRLLKVIMRPAAVTTLLSGGLLAHFAGVGLEQSWFVAKLAGVAAMYIYHGMLEIYVAGFMTGRRSRSSRYFRILNEVPTVLLVWIVIWVVVKPLS